jgi:hypothetical protein
LPLVQLCQLGLGTSGNATAATIAPNGGGLSAGALGGIVGGVLGVALVFCAVAICFLCRVRRNRAPRFNRTNAIKLGPIPSGRTEDGEGESIDEKGELEEETGFAKKGNGGNGLRYIEDDDVQWGLPSGRLQPTY